MQDKLILIPCWELTILCWQLVLPLFTVSPRERKDFSTWICWNKFPLILSYNCSPLPSSSVLQGCDINLEISHKVFSQYMISIPEIFIVLTGMVLGYLIMGYLLVLIMSLNISELVLVFFFFFSLKYWIFNTVGSTKKQPRFEKLYHDNLKKYPKKDWQNQTAGLSYTCGALSLCKKIVVYQAVQKN